MKTIINTLPIFILTFILTIFTFSSFTYSTQPLNDDDDVFRITGKGDIYINGSKKGEIESDGDVYKGGSKKGEIESDGDIYMGGSKVGEIESDGDVYKGGSKIGEVESDGDIYRGGSKIGECEGVKREWVGAVVFFFFKSELGL